MGLNDSNAENKQSVNDCSEIKEILKGLRTKTYYVENKFVCPDGRTTRSAPLRVPYSIKTHSQQGPTSGTYIRGFELVDDGSFATVVQSQTQNVDLFLPQAEPARQFVQQPH